jgi:hypothetical protein
MRLIVIILFLLGGCAAPLGGRQISGRDWRAANLNGVPVLPGSSVTLRLEGGDRVSGSAGCNLYSGTYRLMSKEGIDFTTLTTTRKACAPDLMDQERRFLSILEAVEGHSFYSDGSFSLVSPDGRAIRFRY